jgi:hypothetical protein
MADLMKTLRLSIVVVASAMSLATANAMPDLGRATGTFIRAEEPTPKDVRTFKAGKASDWKPNLSILVPWHPSSALA